jgi:hypothetical protein
MTQTFRKAAAAAGAGLAIAAADLCFVQHSTNWATIGDKHREQWLVVSRAVSASDRLQRGTRYLRRRYESTDDAPTDYRPQYDVQECAGISNDFVNNGQFADAYIPPYHCLLVPSLSDAEGSLLRDHRRRVAETEPVGRAHPPDPIVSDADAMRQGVCVAEPVLRLWPLPVALMQQRDLSSSAPLLARAARMANVPYVDELGPSGLSPETTVAPERVSRMPSDIYEAAPLMQ